MGTNTDEFGRRMLEEMPYIDIEIEPGDPELETLDTSKLNFDYDAFFLDPTTIKIALKFFEPMYVSSS